MSDDDSDERQYGGTVREIGLNMKSRIWMFYSLMLLATAVVLMLGVMFSVIGDVIIAVFVIITLISTMVLDKRIIHIPPMMLVVAVGTMYLAIAGKVFVDNPYIDIVCDVLTGFVLGLCGIIAVYTLTKSMPGDRNENPAVVSLFAFTSTATVAFIWQAISYFSGRLFYVPGYDTDNFMLSGVSIMIGAAVVSVLYYENKHAGLFQHTVNMFLENNSGTLGLEDSNAYGVMKLIEEGESDHLEFKSTLRTNLQTGERDKRMEKAVLKTIVAFLNTNGGTLLVGVTDDGGLNGIDDEDFDNRDKLNLHVTNLIASQIGNEFLPFISFRIVDVEEKGILVFDCKRCEKPVFLKDGNIEIFFVRSGPSSVELTGMNLIKYINNRKKF
jgi:hypothetical protein